MKFNELVTTCVVELNNVASIGNSQNTEKDNLIREKVIVINSAINDLQRMDWEIRNYMQFCPKSANNVTSLQAKLILLLRALISEKKGDLEEIMSIKPSNKAN